jgi:hypothetical protein
MVGGNGTERGCSADEKTKEIFARVVGDIQAVADMKNLGHVHTYNLSIRTGEATIVTVKAGKNQDDPAIIKKHTINLYELDDHANLDDLRAQLAEKGHVFDCVHSFEASRDMLVEDVKKKGRPKWKFWASQSAEDQLKISKLNNSKLMCEEAKNNRRNKLPPFPNQAELEELEEEGLSTVSSTDL